MSPNDTRTALPTETAPSEPAVSTDIDRPEAEAPVVDGPSAATTTVADGTPEQSTGVTADAPTGADTPSGVERSGRGRHSAGLFLNELHTVFRRTRSLVLLAALAIGPIGLGAAVKVAAPSPGRGPAFLGDITGNGLFLVFAAFVVMLPIFLPMVVGVVAGESIAGEAGMGTLRYLLVAPAGRTRLLLAKLTAVITFCFAATFTVAVSGLVTGAVLFPLGRVTLLSGDTIALPSALLRALLIALLVTASLVGIAAVGVFVSTMTDTPLAAMATTVGIAVVAQILDSIPQLSALHPWLFSHYWMSFDGLLRSPVYAHDILRNLGEQAGYLAVFGTAAWARLSNRDVTA